MHCIYCIHLSNKLYLVLLSINISRGFMSNKNSSSHSGNPHFVPPTGVKLDPELKARLEQLSVLKDRSTHWLMKRAIEQYVATEEQAEALKQETLRRWAQEAELNDVVENDIVMTWLDTWGKDEGEFSR